MKKLLPFVLCQLLVIGLGAQKEMPQSSRDVLNYGAFKPGPYSLFYGQYNPQGEVKGDIYLDTIWRTAAVWFYPAIVRRYDPNASDSISGYQVRLDLQNKLVEFYLDEKASLVDPGAVKKIAYDDPVSGPVVLVNTQQYRANQEKLPGFFRLIGEGSLEVVQYTRLQVRKPTFNAALNVGSKDVKYYKQQEYYYRFGNEKSLEKFSPSSSFFKKLGGKKGQQTYEFIKENDLNPKEVQDLIRVVGYYNR